MKIVQSEAAYKNTKNQVKQYIDDNETFSFQL